MTDEDLEKVARAATPGPWEYERGGYIQGVTPVPVDWADEPHKPVVINDPNVFDRPEDKAFIIAFDPATALALLERIRKAEARVKELETVPQCENGCDREAFREAHPYCGGCKSIYENDD